MYQRSLALVVVFAALALVPAASSGLIASPKVPQRIISLSPTATETLFAIGAGRQVVAVDDQSNYPKQAPMTKLSGYTPNAEAIAGYRPDLVVVAYDSKGIVEALRKLRIRVLHLDAAASLDEAYAQIQQLGSVAGHPSEAAALVKQMKKRIAVLVASVPKSLRGRTVYHELGPDFYSATSKTFIGRVYSLFGLKNIADAADASSSGYPQLSAEYIVSSSPDLIVLADIVCCGQTAAKVAARPGWNQIAAVKTGSIVRIDDSIASRWGPRIVNLVKAVATALKRLK